MTATAVQNGDEKLKYLMKTEGLLALEVSKDKIRLSPQLNLSSTKPKKQVSQRIQKSI